MDGFIMETPTRMDDWGYPHFRKSPFSYVGMGQYL